MIGSLQNTYLASKHNNQNDTSNQQQQQQQLLIHLPQVLLVDQGARRMEGSWTSSKRSQYALQPEPTT